MNDEHSLRNPSDETPTQGSDAAMREVAEMPGASGLDADSSRDARTGSGGQSTSVQPELANAPTLAAMLSGFAAVFVGAVYAFGGLARAGELAANGYSVQDTFPLTPLQQILARGLAVMLDPRVLLGALPIAIYMWQHLRPWTKQHPKNPEMVCEEQWQERRRWADHLARLYGELTDAHPSGALREDEGQIAELRASVVADARPNDAEANRQRKAIIKSTKSVRRHVRWHAHQSDAATHVGKAYARWKRQRLARWIVILGAILYAYVLLTVELPGLAVILGQGAWVLVAWGDGVQTTRRRRLAIAAAVVAMVLSCSAYLDTRQLQRIDIRMQSGAVVRGDLIATSGTDGGGTWFVGESPRNIRAVQMADAESTRISRPEHEDQPYDNKSLLDVMLGRD